MLSAKCKLQTGRGEGQTPYLRLSTVRCQIIMAQLLKFNPTSHSQYQSQSLASPNSSSSHLHASRGSLIGNPNPKWAALQHQLKCDGRHSCLFADDRKKEQARRTLEDALRGKKAEFEKWNKEIQKREETMGGGGGASGRGGWFGGGGWFRRFGGANFWEESQQAILTILAMISLYLLLAKGNTMFAIVSNSLLFVLRGSRNWFAFLSSKLSSRTSLSAAGPGPATASDKEVQVQLSAKERVVRKWGMD